MTCTPITLPGGDVLVDSRGALRKHARCSLCRMAPATQVCDGKLSTGSCGVSICLWCAKPEGALDFCPSCARARILAEVSRWPEGLRADFEERAGLIEDGCHETRAKSERMAFDLLKREAPPTTQLGLKLEE